MRIAEDDYGEPLAGLDGFDVQFRRLRTAFAYPTPRHRPRHVGCAT
jgi:hypothetical protein